MRREQRLATWKHNEIHSWEVRGTMWPEASVKAWGVGETDFGCFKA